MWVAGWVLGPVWTGAENLAPPPRFDPRAVQPVARHCVPTEPSRPTSALFQLNAVNSDYSVSTSKAQISKPSSFQLRDTLILLKYSLHEQNHTHTHLPSAYSDAGNVILTNILQCEVQQVLFHHVMLTTTQHMAIMSSTSTEFINSPHLLPTHVPSNHEHGDCTVL